MTKLATAANGALVNAPTGLTELEIILIVGLVVMFGLAMWSAWGLERAKTKNKALQGQIAHLTKQADIYKKSKKSAAGKKGIETIKRRGKKK